MRHLLLIRVLKRGLWDDGLIDRREGSDEFDTNVYQIISVRVETGIVFCYSFTDNSVDKDFYHNVSLSCPTTDFYN